MAKQDNASDSLEQQGWRKASTVIEGFRNRRVHFIEPLGLALMTNRRDPNTGMPGIPKGAVLEIAGGAGKSKSSIIEHYFKNIMKEYPKAKCALLMFEDIDRERLMGLQDQGLDLDRLYLLDYSNSSLETAEVGLNLLLDLAQNDPDVEAVGIDSIGAMAVSKEVFADKSDELKGVDKTPQMAIRANILTRFINQWITLNALTRPTLVFINHMKDQIGQEDFSTFQLKVNQIGEDLNLITPGGVGFKYHCNMRIKVDAKKWPPPKSTDPKHPLYGYREQKGLEVHVKAYRNRYFAGGKEAQAILDFTDPDHVRFNLEDEVISCASYLDIDGIQKSGNGRVSFPLMGDKSYWEKDVVEYMRAHPEVTRDLIKKIAPRAKDMFKFKEKKDDKPKL